MVLARVRTAATCEVLSRTTLFTWTDRVTAYEPMYDLDPRDGSFLLVERRSEDDTHLTVILNWFANLAAGRLETAEAGPAQ